MLDEDIALGWPYVYVHDVYVCKYMYIYINMYIWYIYILIRYMLHVIIVGMHLYQ